MASWSRADFVTYVAARNWRPSTTQKVTSVCRAWIKWAQDCSVAMPDFVGTFRPPAGVAAEADSLTTAEKDVILAHAKDDRLHIPILLAAYAGLSRADIRVLSWEAVDMEALTLTYRRSKMMSRGGHWVTVPLRVLCGTRWMRQKTAQAWSAPTSLRRATR